MAKTRNTPAKGKGSFRTVAARPRLQQALELRAAGKSYSEIARVLGYHGHAGAQRAVARALQLTLQEPAEECRMLELARLDKLLEVYWPLAQAVSEETFRVVQPDGTIKEQKLLQANRGYLDDVLSILDRRYKLLGLDKIKPQGPGATWQPTEELKYLLIEIRQMSDSGVPPPPPTYDVEATPVPANGHHALPAPRAHIEGHEAIAPVEMGWEGEEE